MAQLVGTDALAGSGAARARAPRRPVDRRSGARRASALRRGRARVDAGHARARGAPPARRARRARGPIARSDDALRIAHWLLDAGQPIPLELCIEAADAAILAGAVELGARLADAGARETAAAPRPPCCSPAATSSTSATTRPRPCSPRTKASLTEPGHGVRLPRAALDAALLGPPAGRRRARAARRARESWWPDPAWRRRVEPIRLYLQWLVHGARRDARRRPRRCSPTPSSSRRSAADSRSSTRPTCSSAAASRRRATLALPRAPVACRCAGRPTRSRSTSAA